MKHSEVKSQALVIAIVFGILLFSVLWINIQETYGYIKITSPQKGQFACPSELHLTKYYSVNVTATTAAAATPTTVAATRQEQQHQGVKHLKYSIEYYSLDEN